MTQLFWFLQKKFLYYFGLLISCDCLLFQSNLSVTEDKKVVDPLGFYKKKKSFRDLLQLEWDTTPSS